LKPCEVKENELCNKSSKCNNKKTLYFEPPLSSEKLKEFDDPEHAPNQILDPLMIVSNMSVSRSLPVIFLNRYNYFLNQSDFLHENSQYCLKIRAAAQSSGKSSSSTSTSTEDQAINQPIPTQTVRG
jgi:hypothetical protein